MRLEEEEARQTMLEDCYLEVCGRFPLLDDCYPSILFIAQVYESNMERGYNHFQDEADLI